MQPHQHHRFNLALFFAGLGLTLLLSQLPAFRQLLIHLGSFGYLSAIIAGALFASTFTFATGGLILLDLASTLSPIGLILAGVAGALLTDFFIFKFVKDDVAAEITPTYEQFIRHHHLNKILHTKYFAWTLPVIGALILASPLPDELGISLMSLSQTSSKKILLISSASHAIGMGLIILTASLI